MTSHRWNVERQAIESETGSAADAEAKTPSMLFYGVRCRVAAASRLHQQAQEAVSADAEKLLNHQCIGARGLSRLIFEESLNKLLGAFWVKVGNLIV